MSYEWKYMGIKFDTKEAFIRWISGFINQMKEKKPTSAQIQEIIGLAEERLKEVRQDISGLKGYKKCACCGSIIHFEATICSSCECMQ